VREFHYREATSADVAAMAECRMADVEAGPADERMARYFDGQHHPQQALAPRTGFLACSGDQVVGYIAGHATTRFDCQGEVQYLYVAPAMRRRGMAAQLLRFLADWFDQRGIRRVCVNANLDSPGAVPFYVANHAMPLNRHWYVWDDMRTVLSAEG
jgi:GNAT superfamily N-acetyltransferase